MTYDYIYVYVVSRKYGFATSMLEHTAHVT